MSPRDAMGQFASDSMGIPENPGIWSRVFCTTYVTWKRRLCRFASNSLLFSCRADISCKKIAKKQTHRRLEELQISHQSNSSSLAVLIILLGCFPLETKSGHTQVQLDPLLRAYPAVSESI